MMAARTAFADITLEGSNLLRSGASSGSFFER